MTLVKVGIREILVVWEELILIVTEADHVITTPVLVKEFSATLLIYVIETWFCAYCRSSGIRANLVEQLLRS